MSSGAGSHEGLCMEVSREESLVTLIVFSSYGTQIPHQLSDDEQYIGGIPINWQ